MYDEERYVGDEPQVEASNVEPQVQFRAHVGTHDTNALKCPVPRRQRMCAHRSSGFNLLVPLEGGAALLLRTPWVMHVAKRIGAWRPSTDFEDRLRLTVRTLARARPVESNAGE
jgi:hypothetical protein